MLKTALLSAIGVVVVFQPSTLSALVLTSSSTLTIDLIKPNMKNGMDDKKQIFTMRIL